MFIEKKEVTQVKNDIIGNPITVKKTVYLFEGQAVNTRNLHPDVQAYNKKLFMLQEEKMVELGRPISIFEILNPLDKIGETK